MRCRPTLLEIHKLKQKQAISTLQFIHLWTMLRYPVGIDSSRHALLVIINVHCKIVTLGKYITSDPPWFRTGSLLVLNTLQKVFIYNVHSFLVIRQYKYVLFRGYSWKSDILQPLFPCILNLWYFRKYSFKLHSVKGHIDLYYIHNLFTVLNWISINAVLLKITS